MNSNFADPKVYWDKRFQDEGRLWGDSHSRTAEYALELFHRHKVSKILIPGSGYGRNSRFFSASGFDVTGIEISEVAGEMAKKYDPLTRFYQGSVLNMSFDRDKYDAIYCFNVLHFFLENDRKLFLKECADKLKDNGLMFFTVFSDREPSFGKGKEIEKNTFESRPGRLAHYFTEDNLREHFKDFKTLEIGILEDPEDHGGGPHTHILRYILAQK
jgi:SAM-dependent methyltransferase